MRADDCEREIARAAQLLTLGAALGGRAEALRRLRERGRAAAQRLNALALEAGMKRLARWVLG